MIGLIVLSAVAVSIPYSFARIYKGKLEGYEVLCGIVEGYGLICGIVIVGGDAEITRSLSCRVAVVTDIEGGIGGGAVVSAIAASA